MNRFSKLIRGRLMPLFCLLLILTIPMAATLGKYIKRVHVATINLRIKKPSHDVVLLKDDFLNSRMNSNTVKLVFGNKCNYTSQISGINPKTTVNTTESGTAYLYEDTATMTAYILAEDDTAIIYANPSCNKMFQGFSSLTEIEFNNFNTSKVTSMFLMFSNCGALTKLDLSCFDTSNVTSMYGMFSGCRKLAELNGINVWDTSKVTNMSQMFFLDSSNKYSNKGSLQELDLSNWNTSNVTDMSSMFAGCTALSKLNINGWDTSKVTDMSQMFYNCDSFVELDLSGLDTSSVTNMYWMFRHYIYTTTWPIPSGSDRPTKLQKLDLSGWDTSNVTNMTQMFYQQSKLTTIYADRDWNTSKVTSYSNMFASCQNLKGGNGTGYANGKTKEYARIDGGTSNPGYFTYKAPTAAALWTENFDLLPSLLTDELTEAPEFLPEQEEKPSVPAIYTDEAGRPLECVFPLPEGNIRENAPFIEGYFFDHAELRDMRIEFISQSDTELSVVFEGGEGMFTITDIDLNAEPIRLVYRENALLDDVPIDWAEPFGEPIEEPTEEPSEPIEPKLEPDHEGEPEWLPSDAKAALEPEGEYAAETLDEETPEADDEEFLPTEGE